MLFRFVRIRVGELEKRVYGEEEIRKEKWAEKNRIQRRPRNTEEKWAEKNRIQRRPHWGLRPIGPRGDKGEVLC